MRAQTGRRHHKLEWQGCMSTGGMKKSKIITTMAIIRKVKWEKS
jgi:hypothetical protein